MSDESEANEAILRVLHASKSYRAFARPWLRLAEAVLRRPLHQEFRALEDVSFTLQRGESLGIIGENGAGKSTLLRLLAGVSRPSAGSVTVHGRTAAILELGGAFHPEFTGRQNIRINAALAGLDAHQVEEATPRIIAWSELGAFIDRPVKTYSTGMTMRLAFAVATQVEPEILIVDEALAVGDGYFQKKCIDQMTMLVESGTALLFCTHAMYYVSAFCARTMWLRGGRVEALGETREVVEGYERYLELRRAAAPVPPPEHTAGERPGRIVAAEVARAAHNDGAHRLEEPFRVDVEWTSERPELHFHLGLGIDRRDGVQIAAFSTHYDGRSPFTGRVRYRVTFELPALPITQGEFTLYVYLLDEAALHVYDQRLLPQALRVRSERYRTGLLDARHSWVEQTSAPLAEAPRQEAPVRGAQKGALSRP